MYEESGSPADKARSGLNPGRLFFGSVVRRFEAKKNRNITGSRCAQMSRSLFVASRTRTSAIREQALGPRWGPGVHFQTVTG